MPAPETMAVFALASLALIAGVVLIGLGAVAALTGSRRAV